MERGLSNRVRVACIIIETVAPPTSWHTHLGVGEIRGVFVGGHVRRGQRVGGGSGGGGRGVMPEDLIVEGVDFVAHFSVGRFGRGVRRGM